MFIELSREDIQKFLGRGIYKNNVRRTWHVRVSRVKARGMGPQPRERRPYRRLHTATKGSRRLPLSSL